MADELGAWRLRASDNAQGREIKPGIWGLPGRKGLGNSQTFSGDLEREHGLCQEWDKQKLDQLPKGLRRTSRSPSPECVQMTYPCSSHKNKSSGGEDTSLGLR